jgi:lysozyme
MSVLKIYENQIEPLSQLENHSQRSMVFKVYGAFGDLRVHSIFYFAHLSRHHFTLFVRWAKWIFLVCSLCIEIDLSEKYMNDKAKRIAAATVIATSLATGFEGLRQYAYNDTGGILTVCKGHTGKDVISGKKYSLQECDAFMTEDMRRSVEQVERCIPDLPPTLLGAFADVVFNSGPTVVCNFRNSHAARYLASGQYELACKELPKWANARVAGVLVPLPGLVKRRQAEMEICLKDLP